jgi:hypothetical protein
MTDQYLGRLIPNLDVCDIDGQKIGTVAHVYRDEFASALEQAGASGEPAEQSSSGVLEVKTGLLGLGEHLYIPIDAIDNATAQCVFVTRKKKELAQEWHHKPEYLDRLQ